MDQCLNELIDFNISEKNIDTNSSNNFILTCLLISIVLNSYKVGSLLLSQYLLIISVICFFVKKNISFNKLDCIILVLSTLYSILSLFYLINKPWFSFMNFLQSFANLNVVLFSFFILMNLKKFDIIYIISFIKKVFYMIIILEFLQLILAYQGIVITYTFPQIWISPDVSSSMFTLGIPRPKAIFAEPSWLAIALFNLFFPLIINQSVTTIDIIIYSIASISTLSLTAILTVLSSISIILLYKKNSSTKKMFFFIILICLVGFYCYLFRPEMQPLNFLYERFLKAISGNDASTKLRFKTTKLFSDTMRISPLFGAGLGNIGNFSAYLGHFHLGKGRLLNNFLDVIFIGFGIFGFLLFSFIILIQIYRSKAFKSYKCLQSILIFILCHCIVSGQFISSTFWIPLGIILRMQKDEIKVAINGEEEDFV